MQRMRTRRRAARLIAALLAAALTVGACPAARAGDDVPAQSADGPAAEETVLDNGRLRLTVQPDGSGFCLTDSKSGVTYAATPADYTEDTVAQGINVTRMRSLLSLTFQNGSGVVDTVNSCVGAVLDGNAAVRRDGDAVCVTFTFAEQGITVPLRLRLDGGSLVASIDLAGVREDGGCRLLQIELLPFFGAAREGDRGSIVFPDGSGSLIRFNNGRYANGEYRRAVYGGDRTQVSESKPNGYRPVLLPAFAMLYEHLAPLKTADGAAASAGRDVQAGFLALIRSGAADSEVAAAVAGYDSGYNTAAFTLRYRTGMETTLLSRTWAEITRVMVSDEPALTEDPTVEYRFLSGDEATLKGAADACAARLLPQEMRGGSLCDELYLDITAGVRTQHQFLGFGYQAVTPLTTLEQTDRILTALSDAGIDRFAVRLRGIDDSGAYYGKIDSRIGVDRRIGSKKELRALTEKWGQIYPEVNLTAFTRNSFGATAFFDSVTAVTKKTAKLFDYHPATGLRDYDRPTRYLLRPEKVERAADRLLRDAQKNGIGTLAPTSLAQDLYSNFGGGSDPIGQTEARFAALLGKLAGGSAQLLEAPNAYALPFADRLLSLPATDSGDHIRDAAVPFLQLVLDGLRSYSVPAVNYAGDPQIMLLDAIGSNSALCYDVIWAGYDAVARTAENGLYSSTFSAWESEICAAAKTLAAVRERTGGSAIRAYTVIDDGLRRVDFQNGSTVYINYGSTVRESGGVSVPARGFAFADAAAPNPAKGGDAR